MLERVMEAELSMLPSDPSVVIDLSAPAEPRDLGVVPGLVWAFRIHVDGTTQSLPVDQPIERHRDGGLWLHFNLAHVRAAEWLSGAKLPAPALAMLLSRDRHQQLHASASCVYGIFADFMKRIEGASDEVGHLRFVMTERLLISGRHHALTCVESARVAIEQGGRRLPHVAALPELIIEHVTDAFDQLTDNLVTELDLIESNLTRGSYNAERPRLSRVRQTSAKLHRQLSGLRTLFHRLEQDGTEDLNPPLRLVAGKIAQRLDALDHDIVELRHRAHLLQEEIVAATAEATNRNLHVLAVLTALFLPPTLVTGVFGMNTKGLPFTDMEQAFLWAAAIMIGSALAVYLLMRRIGIFKV
jgi:zinc transporter